MKPFDEFCQALFRPHCHWRRRLDAALKEKGLPVPQGEPPAAEGRRLVEQLPELALIELLYRYSYCYKPNAFAVLAQYKNAHPERPQFVSEFLQNADDAGATSVTFHFLPDEVRVYNNGHAFTHDNLYSICSFLESDKSDPEHIGKFGMGFKTVFRISATPEIYTFDRARDLRLGFRFFEPGGLNREYYEGIKQHEPFDISDQVSTASEQEHFQRVGYILPEPVPWQSVEDAEYVAKEPQGAFFRLPLRESLDRADWNSSRIEEIVPSDVFLFLRN